MSRGKKGTLFPFWTTELTSEHSELHPFLTTSSRVVSRNPQPCEVGWLFMIFQPPTTTWLYGWEVKGEKNEKENENVWAGPGLKLNIDKGFKET